MQQRGLLGLGRGRSRARREAARRGRLHAAQRLATAALRVSREALLPGAPQQQEPQHACTPCMRFRSKSRETHRIVVGRCAPCISLFRCRNIRHFGARGCAKTHSTRCAAGSGAKPAGRWREERSGSRWQEDIPDRSVRRTVLMLVPITAASSVALLRPCRRACTRRRPRHTVSAPRLATCLISRVFAP